MELKVKRAKIECSNMPSCSTSIQPFDYSQQGYMVEFALSYEKTRAVKELKQTDIAIDSMAIDSLRQ